MIDVYPMLLATVFLMHNLEEMIFFNRMPKFRYAKKFSMGAKSRWISAIRIPFRYLIKSLEVQQQAA
jgi:hypothetical protein